LVGKKLKQPTSPQLPTGRPAQLAPLAWAQSSTTLRPWRSVYVRTSFEAIFVQNTGAAITPR
jgi:hypothetical protein